MTPSPREQLRRQVGRVRRRLFLQTLGRRVVLCGLIGLLLYAGFLLSFGLRSETWALDSGVMRVRLLELGGVALVAAVFAAGLAWPKRPSLGDAALAIDGAFGLQERVTTCLALRQDEEISPAGQALLLDTGKRTEKLALRQTYALGPSRRSALLVPALGVVILAMLFCDAWPSPRDPDAAPVTPEQKAELEDVTKRLREMAPPKQAKGEKERRSGEFDKIAAEMERLAGERPKTQGEARELIKDMTSLEDRMRRLDKSLAERAETLRKQGEEADRLARKKKPGEKSTPPEQGAKEGDFRQAMKEGDFRAAADELKRLSREMQQQQRDMTPRQREEMDRQMADLKERLDRLADMMQKQGKERGNGAEEQLDREQIEDLKGMEARDLADLKEAVEALERAMKAMQEGKEGEAMRLLAEAAEKMGRLDPKGDQEGLARQLAMLQALRERVGRQMGGGNPTPASGKRPDMPQEDLKGRDTQAKGGRTPGGLSGFRFVPGAGLREPKSPEELRGLIDEAGREAAEAAQRQRLPRGDAEMTRGFYEKLRGEPRK